MGTTIHTIDLRFLRLSRMIASFAVRTRDEGFVLIECGPASTVPGLEKGLRAEGLDLEGLRGILLTHVHVDHSGAAGTLVDRVGCPVYVHPRGAAHLADPSKLLASAKRLYGRLLEPLWGITSRVPQDLLHTVDDGETVHIGGTEFRGWHTPGHAAHHVAWQVGDAVATGDVGGVRFPGHRHVSPPMPPPDIDVGLWRESIDRLRGLTPERLLVTHFGAHDDPGRHLDELEDRIQRWADLGAAVVEAGGAVEDLTRRLNLVENRELRASGVGFLSRLRYRMLGPTKANAVGLHRSLSKSVVA